MPCHAGDKAALGAPCCTELGGQRAPHHVALGVHLMAPPASPAVPGIGQGPHVERGQGYEKPNSLGTQPGVGSSGRTPRGSSSGPVGHEAGGQAPAGLPACSMQQARLPTITFVTMQLEPDY